MRALVQRVSSANVQVKNQLVGEIAAGLLVLLGVKEGDDRQQAEFLADKTAHLRVFADDQGKMNRSVLDIQGSVLVVSQFTLYGDCRKGRRPSFIEAARPEVAKDLYEYYCEQIRKVNVPVAQGIFQADMQVSLVNDGPVTLILES